MNNISFNKLLSSLSDTNQDVKTTTDHDKIFLKTITRTSRPPSVS